MLKDNLCNIKNNNLSKFKNIITKIKIDYYFVLAKEYGLKDKGQAIIISNDKIILEEDNKGTDFLINQFKNKNELAFLVKVSKPNQDLRIDLPTIGPQTIKNIIKAGIKGIIVEEDKTFVDNPKLTFNLIKEYNIVYYACKL